MDIDIAPVVKQEPKAKKKLNVKLDLGIAKTKTNVHPKKKRLLEQMESNDTFPSDTLTSATSTGPIESPSATPTNAPRDENRHYNDTIGPGKEPFYFGLSFGDMLEIKYKNDDEYYNAYAIYYSASLNKKHWRLYITYDGFDSKWNENLDLSDADTLARLRPFTGTIQVIENPKYQMKKVALLLPPERTLIRKEGKPFLRRMELSE
jgi:hypothetical protein